MAIGFIRIPRQEDTVILTNPSHTRVFRAINLQCGAYGPDRNRIAQRVTGEEVLRHHDQSQRRADKGFAGANLAADGVDLVHNCRTRRRHIGAGIDRMAGCLQRQSSVVFHNETPSD